MESTWCEIVGVRNANIGWMLVAQFFPKLFGVIGDWLVLFQHCGGASAIHFGHSWKRYFQVCRSNHGDTDHMKHMGIAFICTLCVCVCQRTQRCSTFSPMWDGDHLIGIFQVEQPRRLTWRHFLIFFCQANDLAGHHFLGLSCLSLWPLCPTRWIHLKQK